MAEAAWRTIKISGSRHVLPISPLVGEMPGRAEGGVPRSLQSEKQDMPHAPVPPQRRANARRMRKAMTDAELKLWNELRAHRLMGLSFRRQMPIAGYIVDFACPVHRLIVEIDGSQHALVPNFAYDEIRTQRLQADGWTVLRFWNDDILRDIDNVCSHIIRTVGTDLL
jgi:very-short-patch-repair endonuclease